MYIDNINRKLEVVLTAAKTTSDMPIVVSYIDKTNQTEISKTNTLLTNGTTAVTFLPTVDIGSTHTLTEVTICNTDTAAKTLQLLYNDNGVQFQKLQVILQVGDSIIYTVQRGWFVQDSSGNTKTTSTIAGLLSTSPSTGIGYATGAGASVTQITNRSQGVVINAICGTITTNTTSLAAGASAEFTVTNSSVAIGDVVVVAQRSGSSNVAGVAGVTHVSVVTVAAGSFIVSVDNKSTTTAETGAIIINFAVIKATNS